MNGRQRIACALRGEWPDARPVMLHNFMSAAAEAGLRMAEYRRSAAAVARAIVAGSRGADCERRVEGRRHARRPPHGSR